jgi:hypothetical protein
MKDFLLLMFSVTGGLCLSGIAANLYRIAVGKAERKPLLYYSVMVVAGPSTLFENATANYRAKKCSRWAYGLAVCLVGYWAFALGLLTIAIGMHL